METLTQRRLKWELNCEAESVSRPLERRPSSPGDDDPVASGERVRWRAADHPVQPAALNTLHGVVAKCPSLPDIEDRDDMRMVQPRGRASLVQEPAPRRPVGGA